MSGFGMTYPKRLFAALAVAFTAAGADAATLVLFSGEPSGTAAHDAAEAGLTRTRRANFEGLAPGERTTPLDTDVGDFRSLGGVGSGATVTGTPGNTGRGIYLRRGRLFGRSNTTPGGDGFLDSNDSLGIGWQARSAALFDTVMFRLIDVGDAGGALDITADGTVLGRIAAGRPDGRTNGVLIRFDRPRRAVAIGLQSSRLNDGFGLDDATLRQTAAPVPLPPGLLLLGGAAAALALLRRARAS